MTRSPTLPSPMIFFDPEASPDGLIAMGGQLDVQHLTQAYAHGFFPWPCDDASPIPWFSPDPRGILRRENVHVPRSLKRTLRRSQVDIRTDTSFDAVIEACATIPRKNQRGTWITPAMQHAYRQLHDAGLAHSIEVFFEDSLVGGLYGVFVGNVFSAESMFHLKSDASKVALLSLMSTLERMGITWIDTQVCTEVVCALGGETIARKEFYTLLQSAQERPISMWPSTPDCIK